MSFSKSEIIVGERLDIRADVTKKDGTHANNIQVEFTVSDSNVAVYVDNVGILHGSLTPVTGADGTTKVIIMGKNKGTIVVKAIALFDGKKIETNRDIQIV